MWAVSRGSASQRGGWSRVERRGRNPTVECELPIASEQVTAAVTSVHMHNVLVEVAAGCAPVVGALRGPVDDVRARLHQILAVFDHRAFASTSPHHRPR